MGRRTYGIIDSGDVEIMFDGSEGITAGRSVDIARPPKSKFTTTQSYGVPGERVEGIRHLKKRVSLPVIVFGDTPEQREERLEDLFARIDPVRGPVTLRCHRADDTIRELSCYHADTQSLVDVVSTDTTSTGVLIFDAFFPYWKLSVDQTIEIETTLTDMVGVETLFDGPIDFDADIPFDGETIGDGFDDADIAFDAITVPFDGGGSGTLIAAAPNPGDVDAYPKWTVVGPATDIVFELIGSNVIEYGPDLAAGETLVIDTDPYCHCATVNGQNVFKNLSDRSFLWHLPSPGKYGTSPAIAIRARNMVDGVSSINGIWTPLFLTS